MTQKKGYSRFFIILQEDEKGYGIASDKQPSGYTKLETKNDKCKISYYVQNLKKENDPYYMVLICSKKEVNKIIKIGELNIDENGRADITLEYNENNIANTGISIDKITGAAIIKQKGSSIISTICGFASNDIPVWKKYEVVGENKIVQNVKEIVEVHNEKIVPKAETKQEIKKEDNIFEKYEKKIEEVKVSGETFVESSKIEESNKEVIPKEEFKLKEKIEENLQPLLEENLSFGQMQFSQREQEDKSANQEDIPVKENKLNNENNERKINVNDRHKKEKDYPKGNVGKFFKHVIKDFEEIEDICTEIKRCRWYRVPVDCLEEMYDTLDYNKYTVVYYPMISYYPYIKKYGHYMMGLKCDASGKMKYLVYAIPGSMNKVEQPFGGKSGFVTWVPIKDSKADDNYGYWLMFYDFRNSTIVIPVR